MPFLALGKAYDRPKQTSKSENRPKKLWSKPHFDLLEPTWPADHTVGNHPDPGQSRHQDTHQQSDDRDNDQQLYQRKTFLSHLSFPLYFSEIH
jgi:hypothetical protein